MTIVVWDGKTIAADRQITRGDQVSSRVKLKRLDSGAVVCTCGDADRGLMLIDWYINGKDPAVWPAFQRADTGWVILVVVECGQVYEYNQEPVAIPVEAPYDAWGSGSSFALGALAMGATASQAVEAASKHCNTCGMGVDAFDVSQ